MKTAKNIATRIQDGVTEVLDTFAASQDTYMADHHRENAFKLCCGVVGIHRPRKEAPGLRECDWSTTCPKCGRAVVALGQSPWAECRKCEGRVFLVHTSDDTLTVLV